MLGWFRRDEVPVRQESPARPIDGALPRAGREIEAGLSPRERMLSDIQDLCRVSSFFDPKLEPSRLSPAQLTEYLRSSHQRLEALNAAFTRAGYAPRILPFEYQGQRALNAIYSAGVDSKRQIWFVAHHDHRAALGAEDNGTALAVMLEIARMFRGTPIEPHLRFGSFDLEEICCVGSFVYANKLGSYDLSRIACVIDLECLGSGPHVGVARSVGPRPIKSDPSLVDGVTRAANALGYRNFVADDFDFFWADHVPFAQRGLPTVSLYSLDHESYRKNRGLVTNDRINCYGSVAHSEHDVPARINGESLEQVALVMGSLIPEIIAARLPRIGS